MGFAGIIAGAMGGAAQGVADQSQGYIDVQNKSDLAKQLSDIEEQRQLRIAQANSQLRRDDTMWDATNEPLNQARLANRKADLGAQADAHLDEVQRGIPIEQQRQAALAPGEIDKANQIAYGAAKAHAQAQADVMKQYATDPAMRAGLQAYTQASHYFSPSDALAQEQLKERVVINGLQTKLANTTDPAERDRLQTQIGDLSGNTKSTKELSIALAQTETAAAKARATLSDPLATQEAKDSARDAVAALDMSARNLQKHLGMAPPEKTFPPAPDAAVKELLNAPTPTAIASFDKHFGPGAAAKARASAGASGLIQQKMNATGPAYGSPEYDRWREDQVLKSYINSRPGGLPTAATPNLIDWSKYNNGRSGG